MIDVLDQFPDPVLTLCAHPDDTEVHAGGTIARLVRVGKRVACVLATSGNRGTGDPTKTMDAVAATREAEQRVASAALGVGDVTFLRFDDGDLMFHAHALRERFIRLIRQKRPRTVITHDPWPGNGSQDACSVYPDHLTTGLAAFQAAYICAPGPLFHPEHLREGLTPWKPEVLYLIMSGNPDTFVDVAPTWTSKWEAVRQHRSQGRDAEGMHDFFRAIAHNSGAQAGLELAEGFRRMLPS